VTRHTTPPPAADWALFLDVDGTLLEFASVPEAVAPAPGLTALLGSLRERLGGALALVSGRPLETLDRLFAPLAPAAAGLHGLERRTAGGACTRVGLRVPAATRAELSAFVRRHPGLVLEDKAATLAVHYRAAPELGPVVDAAVGRAAESLGPAWHVLGGACVAELKPRAANKASAVEAFVREPPFAGRRPVYLGDDRTDLDGFAAAERLGGEAIAVGERVAARWRLADPPAVRAWLGEILLALGAPASGGATR
jgi:trehalose 6-phosphate phosphatase